MERLFLAPFLAMGLCGLIILAFAFGRRDAQTASPSWPLAWFGALAAGLGLLAMSQRSGGPLVLLSQESLVRGGALGLVVAAAALALLGSRARTGADTLTGSAPRPLDEALADARAGRPAGWGVYRGRLGAREPLKSPGGVACAFYEAEVRAAMPDGSRGPLLCSERAWAELITLRGERGEVVVSVAPSQLLAPMQVHRCEPSRLPMGAEVWERAESQPLEALSWERVGPLGETCLVVGELRPGPVQGSWVLRGRGGGPAMLVLGAECEGSGEALSRRAWRLFAAAGALSVVAAFVLARAM